MIDEPALHPITGETLPPATPAATMVIFRDNPYGGAPLLLMVERVKTMAFAGGAVVFPGGKVDEADRRFAAELGGAYDLHETAARLAAIRETIEEAGLALALSGVTDPSECREARAELHSGEDLRAICLRHGWEPALDDLIPWARWRPPGIETRVFDTRFYLVNAGDAHLPGEVDNTENRSLFWDSASGVIDRANRGEVKAIFPTMRNLERLALCDSFAAAAAHAASYPSTLMTSFTEERDGQMHICIPEGFGYPVTAEPMTSALRG